MIATTIVTPIILRPVDLVIDLLGETPGSRLIPSGVISKAQDRISATGKPRMSSKTTSRTLQWGISKNGKTWVAIWIRSQATTPYATATLYTLRRFNSPKSSFGFIARVYLL